MLIILLVIFVIYLLVMYFTYYCAVRGLIYYLATKHSDWISVNKTKELTRMAMKRTIEEFFGRV